MENPASKKERAISFTNIVIGSGLLWLFLYILGPLVNEYDDYMLSSVAETKQHAFILFSVFAAVSLIVGIVAGFIIRKNPLLHGTIIGLISLAVSLLTKVPVKSFNIWTILMYGMSVFLPVVIGTLVGISIKKIKEKKSWLLVLIGLVFMPAYYFGMPLLINKTTEALIQRELGWKEETVENQSVPTLESVPVTENRASETSEKILAEPPKHLSYEEQIMATANEKCPENIYNSNDSWLVFEREGFYTSEECKYDRETKKLIDNKTTKPPESCAPDFASELKKQEYNFINGCLFRGEESVFGKRIHGMIISGEFGEYRTDGKFRDTFGEETKEWFRFQYENKQYIYFLGGAGCGGCIFDGPFLVIDLETGIIEKKSAELPYAYDLLLSPDKKKAIEFEYKGYAYRDNCANTQTCSVKLYIYDFVKTKRTALIYEVPDKYAVLECGMGCYTIKNSIVWTDENHVKIQLYTRDQNGEVQDPYVPEGEPIVIDIRTLTPLSE